jgi:mono/diheme cytochrome c family protein
MVRGTTRFTALFLLLAIGSVRGGDLEQARDSSKVDFSREISPILANTCLLCHGPDAKARKADLRLDTREGAIALHDGKAAIVPGKPDQSELLRRITTTDRDDLMPPAKSGKKLTKDQIGLLRRWIEQGAPYAKHWAFVKPERPVVPDVKSPWIRSEIDRFILARLQKEGLKPSVEADRYALVRRLSLDLTGLPPTIEETDAFANDKDPAAYGKLVDRLLDSPAYGERWGRVWLDLARYADSQGYAEDRPRVIWAYRDWVIKALNANLPFDQFTIEQIAGDLLPNPTEAQLQATGFHRNTLTNTEGGTDDEEFRNFAVIDRVNTTMAVWMGLTFNCAQCHDHKYDPFTQEEFFRLFAFFNQTEDNDQADDRPFLSIFTDEQKKQKKDWEDEIAKLQSMLERSTPELEEARRKWEAALAQPVAWRALKLIAHEPGSLSEDGYAVGAGKSTALGAETDLATIAALRVETPAQPPFAATRLVLSTTAADAKAPKARIVRVELPGKQRYLHLAEVQVFSGGENVALKGKAKQSTTDFGGDAARAIDGNTNGDYNANSVSHTSSEDNPWWEVNLGKMLPVDRVVLWNRTDGGDAIESRMKVYKVVLLDDARKPVEERKSDGYPNPKAEHAFDGVREIVLKASGSVYLPEKPIVVAKGTAFQIKVDHAGPGRFRISATDDLRARGAAEIPGEIQALLKRPEAERSKDEAAKVAAYHRSIAPELAPGRDRLAAVRKQLEAQKPAVTSPIQRDLAENRRRKTAIQIRGNFLVKGKEVTEGVPGPLHPFPENEPKNRLGFARWLVHPENPLTARIVANRYWEQLFGTGLMSTSEDWGVRGEMPSHPELLDWLAVELLSRKWDLKSFIRLIVTSAVYRQSSLVTPELIARDPSNRLLARGPRFRLSAEAVRDQALASSGLLSHKMFGPSVYPPQPKSGLSAAFSNSTDWEPSKGEDRWRRGLYTFWRRSVPYPSMATFDAPDSFVCTVKRIPTNTPLQALVTMNDPVYVECCQALARKVVAQGGTSAKERAIYAFRSCLARPPREAELASLVALFEKSRARYASDAKKALAMATEPLGPAPQGADVAELAAWTVVGNVLINLDEMFLKR